MFVCGHVENIEIKFECKWFEDWTITQWESTQCLAYTRRHSATHNNTYLRLLRINDGWQPRFKGHMRCETCTLKLLSQKQATIYMCKNMIQTLFCISTFMYTNCHRWPITRVPHFTSHSRRPTFYNDYVQVSNSDNQCDCVTPPPQVDITTGSPPLPHADTDCVTPLPQADTDCVTPPPQADTDWVNPPPQVNTDYVTPLPQVDIMTVSPHPHR